MVEDLSYFLLLTNVVVKVMLKISSQISNNSLEPYKFNKMKLSIEKCVTELETSVVNTYNSTTSMHYS